MKFFKNRFSTRSNKFSDTEIEQRIVGTTTDHSKDNKTFYAKGLFAISEQWSVNLTQNCKIEHKAITNNIHIKCDRYLMIVSPLAADSQPILPSSMLSSYVDDIPDYATVKVIDENKHGIIRTYFEATQYDDTDRKPYVVTKGFAYAEPENGLSFAVFSNTDNDLPVARKIRDSIRFTNLA